MPIVTADHRNQTKITVRFPNDKASEYMDFIESYRKSHDLKNLNQAVIAIIGENDRLHMYIRYLGDIRNIEVPLCKRRLFHEGEWWCITRARPSSGPKEKKLLTLDVCAICKVELWKLPEKTQMQTETADPAPIPVQPHVSNAKPYEPKKLYCQNQGRYVYLWECQKCTSPCRRTTPQ